jgi:tetratricopeptide (TPR) repeat protein
MTTNTVAGASSSNGPVGRAVRPPGQLWQVPMFLIGLVALVLVAAAGPLVSKPSDNKLERDLVTIRDALEKPGLPPADIVALAESAVLHISQQPDLAGTAHYLLGTICLRQVENGPQEHKREARDQASMHLELAALRGVPPEDRPRLTYLRGKVLYLTNGDVLRIIDLLNTSLPAGAADPAEGFAMLVQVHLRKAVPDLEAALAASARQIEFSEEEGQLAQARTQRGEILLRLDRRAEALKVLDQAADKAKPKERLKIRLMQAKAAMDQGLWGRAIPWWNELLTDPSSVPGGKGRIYYNLGLCCLNFDQPIHEKEAIAAWQEALLYGAEDAQAAALRLGELRLYSSNSKSALEFFARALDKVSAPADFKNALIDVHKARELMEETCRIFNEQQDAESFEKAAELYKKLAPPGAADEKVAQAREGRGRDLLEKASAGGKDDGVLREQARTWLHDAAQAWEKAAESRTPVDRVDDLWHAVECYQLANNQVQAIAVLRKFVDLPATADKKAQAWFTLAEIQRGLKQVLDAQQSYKQCVAFDYPTFTAKALLNLADMALERHELKEAEDALVQVAYPTGGVADPASHEQALLKLANLLFQQCQFEKAAIQCKEFIKQCPSHASILSVREQLGECYRRLAVQAEATCTSAEPLSAEKKAYYWRERQTYLELERDTYQQLSDDLELRAQAKELAPVEEALRRKALFMVADSWYDLPNWFDKALTCYTKLWESYRLQRDGLYACQRLYRCLVFATNAKLSNVDLVREVTEASVEVNLQNMKTLEEAGAFGNDAERAQWQDWLERVQQWLRTTKRG